MAAPTQIAIFDIAQHDGTAPDAGSYTARVLTLGTEENGTYTLAGVDVPVGALVVPLVPGARFLSAETLAVENIGAEPVIETEGDGALSITIDNGPYAGTYNTRHDGAALTKAMVEAAPTCLRRPVVTGTSAVGATLTITPGLWIYDGSDPGDQTWVQSLDGIPNGETDLDYVIQPADAGRGFTVAETFGGVTVTSAVTAL